MVANIFGERFAGFRQKAWWDIEGAHVFDTPLTAQEAFAQAGMGYAINKYPVFYKMETGAGPVYEPILNQIALVRDITTDDPVRRCFGVVSAEYGLMQNQDIVSIIEPLTEKWPVETIGALGQGETMFITLAAGKMELRGEQIDRYVLITDKRDGKSSANAAITDVRVVCQNTLRMALKQAVVNVPFAHRRGIRADLELRVRLIAEIERALEVTAELYESLMTCHLADEDAAEMIAVSWPIPNTPAKVLMGTQLSEESMAMLPTSTKEAIERAESSYITQVQGALRYRDAANTLYEKFNDEVPTLAKTAWAGWNAVVETADWVSFRKSDSVGQDAMFGKRAGIKQAALDFAMGLLKNE